jgi:hypothetical protein
MKGSDKTKRKLKTMRLEAWLTHEGRLCYFTPIQAPLKKMIRLQELDKEVQVMEFDDEADK